MPASDEREDDRGGEVLEGALWGNIREGDNKPEIDYMEPEAKEGLKNVKGRIAEEVVQDIANEAGEVGAAARAPVSRPIQPAPGAQDYSYERELAEDLAPRPPPLAGMPALMRPPIPTAPVLQPAGGMQPGAQGGFLGDEDDYDFDGGSGAAPAAAPAVPAAGAVPAAAAPTKPPSLLEPVSAAQVAALRPQVPEPPAEPVPLTREGRLRLAAELGLPTLGRTDQEDILQLSDMFGLRPDDVQKYMRQPILAEDAERDAELQAAVKARQATRRRRLAAAVAMRKRAQQAKATASLQDFAAGEDESQLLTQLPSDPQLLAAWQRLQQAGPGSMALLPVRDQVAATGLQLATPTGRRGGDQESGREHRGLMHQGGARLTIKEEEEEESVLAPSQAPLIDPCQAEELAAVLTKQLHLARGLPGAAEAQGVGCVTDELLDVESDHLSDDGSEEHIAALGVYQHRNLLKGTAAGMSHKQLGKLGGRHAGAAATDSKSDMSDADQHRLNQAPESDSIVGGSGHVVMLGLAPASNAEPLSIVRWEDHIVWSPAHSPDHTHSVLALPAPQQQQQQQQEANAPADGASDDTSDPFKRSVIEALADFKERERQRTGGTARASGSGPPPQGPGRPPPRVFAGGAHPQMLRIEGPSEGALPPPGEVGVGSEFLADKEVGQQVAARLGPPKPQALVKQPWIEHVLWQPPTSDQRAAATANSVSGALPSQQLAGALGTSLSEPGQGLMSAAGSAGAIIVRPGDARGPLGLVLHNAQCLQLPPAASTPLVLDLGDPRTAYSTTDADALVHAGAIVVQPPPAEAPVYGPPIVEGDEVARELSRFNISRDAAYGLYQGAGGRKIRAGAKGGAGGDLAGAVLHAEPAATLQTLPARLDAEEAAHFHRPRGRWHPTDLSHLAKGKGTAAAKAAAAAAAAATTQQVDAVIDLTGEQAAGGGAAPGGADGLAPANGHAEDGQAQDPQQQQLVPAEPAQPQPQPQQVLVVMATLAGRTLRFEVPFSFLERSLGEVLEAKDLKGRLEMRFPQALTAPGRQLWHVGPPLKGPLQEALPLKEQGFVGAGDARPNVVAVVCPELSLIPSREACAVPSPESRKPLRPPAAFKTRAALSATEGHVVLAEFFEEVPPLLGRPGMGMKLTTWYRKRGVDDNTPDDLANAVAHAAANELAAGPGRAHEAEPVHLPSLVPGVCLGEGGRVEPWRVGTVQALSPDEESPFLGQIRPGYARLAVEAGMFRAPVVAHTTRPTDFLLIRNAQGVLSLRELTGTLVIGQQHPMTRVLDPKDTEGVGLSRARVVVHAVRAIARQQQAADKKRKKGDEAAIVAAKGAGVKITELEAAYPHVRDIRGLLLQSGLVQRPGTGGSAGNPAVFDLPEGVQPMQEADLRRLVSADTWAAYESGRAAEVRLRHQGLHQPRYLANVEPGLIRLALDMLPLCETPVLEAVEAFEHLLATGLTWSTTEAFVGCLKEQRTVLDVGNPVGDPTGRGHGFALVKRPEPRPGETGLGPGGLKAPEMGSITGSESDLRKLSQKDAVRILLDFGITQEQVNKVTDRWKRIDWIRRLCTAAAADGIFNDLTRKYVRSVKASIGEQIAEVKHVAGKIWDVQLEVLSEDRDTCVQPGTAQMVAAARAKRIKEVEASIARVTARKQGASLEDDEAEYRRLQKEGFFAGGGNKGGAKSSTGTAPPAPATTTTTSGAATAPASQGQPAQPAPAPAQPAPKSKKKKAEAAAAAAAGGADGQKAADGAPAAEGGGEGGGGEGEGAKKVKKPAKPKAAPGEPKEGDRRIRRLITWTAPDGTQRSREVIYTDKNDLQDLHRMCSSRDGFGQRTLRPSPKGSAVKGMVPARLAQQDYTRKKTGGKGGGKAGGKNASALVPAAIPLPGGGPGGGKGGKGAKGAAAAGAGPTGTRQSARPRKKKVHDDDDDEDHGDEGGEDEFEQMLEEQYMIQVVPRSTPAKPKVPKIPGGGGARKPSAPVAAGPCPDCGQLGHASGDPACKKAFVSGDALNDLLGEESDGGEGEDGEGGGEDAYKPGTSRGDRAEARHQGKGREKDSDYEEEEDDEIDMLDSDYDEEFMRARRRQGSLGGGGGGEPRRRRTRRGASGTLDVEHGYDDDGGYQGFPVDAAMLVPEEIGPNGRVRRASAKAAVERFQTLGEDGLLGQGPAGANPEGGEEGGLAPGGEDGEEGGGGGLLSQEDQGAGDGGGAGDGDWVADPGDADDDDEDIGSDAEFEEEEEVMSDDDELDSDEGIAGSRKRARPGPSAGRHGFSGKKSKQAAKKGGSKGKAVVGKKRPAPERGGPGHSRGPSSAAAAAKRGRVTGPAAGGGFSAGGGAGGFISSGPGPSSAAAPAGPAGGFAAESAAPATFDFAPRPLTTPIHTPADAQRLLDSVLRDCVGVVKREKLRVYAGSKSQPLRFGVFFMPVPKVQVPDYNSHVPEAKEMWIDRIAGKVKGHKYQSRAAFEADFAQIHTNAVAYNSPGKGKHANPWVIDNALALVACVAAYLDSRTAEVEAAERTLQAPPPVVGIVVEQQHWSQCDRCQKWRLVPQAVIQSIENSPGTPWFCEMKGGGVTCDTPEDK